MLNASAPLIHYWTRLVAVWDAFMGDKDAGSYTFQAEKGWESKPPTFWVQHCKHIYFSMKNLGIQLCTFFLGHASNQFILRSLLAQAVNLLLKHTGFFWGHSRLVSIILNIQKHHQI